MSDVRSRIRMPLVVLAATLPGAGCGVILDPIEAPERAEVTVTGSTPVPLQLIVSSNFYGVWNPNTSKYDVTLHDADTIVVSALPATRTQPMAETGVFFARLTNPDTEQTAEVTMRVRVDDRDVFTQGGNLRDNSLEYVFYIR